MTDAGLDGTTSWIYVRRLWGESSVTAPPFLYVDIGAGNWNWRSMRSCDTPRPVVGYSGYSTMPLFPYIVH